MVADVRRRAVAIVGGLAAAAFAIWCYEARWSKHDLGEACHDKRDCAAELFCVEKIVVAAPGLPGPSVCSKACSTDADCGSGMRCRDPFGGLPLLRDTPPSRECEPTSWDVVPR